MLRNFVGAVFSISLVFGLATPAQADEPVQSVIDRASDTENLPNYLDISEFAYGETKSRPGTHYFFIGVHAPVPSNAVNDGFGSWAAVLIDADNDKFDDYRISVSGWTLGARSVVADVYFEESLERVPGCTANAYVLPGARNIAFALDYGCLKLPRSFNARAYTDYGSGDSVGYDYAPDDGYERFSHTFESLSGGRRALDRPSLTNEIIFAVPGATSAASGTQKSIEGSLVTVYCEDYVGVGYAAHVNIPANVRKDGFKTYIVTSNFIVSRCLETGKVRISTQGFENHTGYIAAWDAENDYAGLYIEKQLPTLAVRGQAPGQNWWLGMVERDLDLKDSFISGKAEIAPIPDWSFISTSLMATGFSFGAPAVDRTGRVVGIASTADQDGKLTISSSPALCNGVVLCGNTKVWVATTKNPPSPKKYASCSALQKDFPGGVSQSRSKVNKGKAVKFTPYVFERVYNLNKRLDSDKDGIACEK